MAYYNGVEPATIGKPKNKPLTKYPESFKKISTEFFQQCDQRGIPQAKSIVKDQLKVLLEMAIERDKLWTNDWENQKIPFFDSTVRLELVGDIDVTAKIWKQRKKHEPQSGEGEQEEEASKKDRKKKQRQKRKEAVSKPSLKPNNSLHTASSLPMIPIVNSSSSLTSEERKLLRSQRFEKELNAPVAQLSSYDMANVKADKNTRLVGYCQDLEKKYLRLTSEPDPAKVRPLSVLQRSLDFILAKYNANKSKYNYVCDQLKSIRQDLKVQFIENDFTVKVYETHAKIAIENNDLPEFNQCQSCLGPLYKLPNVKGANEAEFLSYKIFYLILTGNFNEICKIKLYELSELSMNREKYQIFKKNILLDRSLKVFESIYSNDYVELFKNHHKMAKLNVSQVYNGKFSTVLRFMSSIAAKFRVRTLRILCQSYRKVTYAFLKESLGLDTEEEAKEFLNSHKLQEFCDDTMFNAFDARPSVIAVHDRIYNRR